MSAISIFMLIYLVNLYCLPAVMRQMSLLWGHPGSHLPEYTMQLWLSSLSTSPADFQKVDPGHSCSGSSKPHPLLLSAKMNFLIWGERSYFFSETLYTPQVTFSFDSVPKFVISLKILGSGKLKLEKVQKMYLFYSVKYFTLGKEVPNWLPTWIGKLEIRNQGAIKMCKLVSQSIN